MTPPSSLSVAAIRRERCRVLDQRLASDRDRSVEARSYETKEGEKRTVFEIDVDDVGPALRYATAKVNRVQRGGGGFGADSGGAAPTEDPWTTGGTTDNFDEPPF